MRLGEIKFAKEVGFKGRGKVVWAKCPDCAKERWLTIWGNKHRHIFLCRPCAGRRRSGEKHWRWKGGRIKHHDDGYFQVLIRPDNFFYPMAKSNSYVLEQRLVMAKYLGRNLASWEIVHHKNGIKDDNRLENLELTTKGSHTLLHNKGYKDGFAKGYQDGLAQAKAAFVQGN